MIDVGTLRTLLGQVSDTYQMAEVVGLNALCIIEGWHFVDDGKVLVPPSGTIADIQRGLPFPQDNPALSVDAAIALAVRQGQVKWPDLMHGAVRTMSERPEWVGHFSRMGHHEQFARAILYVAIEQMIRCAEETGDIDNG